MTFFSRITLSNIFLTVCMIFSSVNVFAAEKKVSTNAPVVKKDSGASEKKSKKSASNKPSNNSSGVQLKPRGSNGSGFLKSYDRLNFQNIVSVNGEPLPTPNILENILQMPTPEVVKPQSKLDSLALIRQGCAAKASSIRNFLESINLQDSNFESNFNFQLPNFFNATTGKCLPFAIALDSFGKIQSLSIVNNDKRDANSTMTTIHRSETSFVYLVESQNLNSGFENYLEVVLDLNDLIVYKSNQANSSIPPELIWEISSLIKELYSKVNNNERYLARIIYNAGDKNNWAQVVSLEILDAVNKTVVADAFWVDRDGLPGGFFTSSGTELEQNFWISPLNYTRISRGVGRSSIVLSKSKQVKKGNANSVVTQNYTYSASHQGIDFAAPIGTPIYAVANGKIIHYGPYPAYGNLVILEHEGNYKTYYAHLSSYNPELVVGSEVRRGLEIGYVGSTGRSTGPHLHFELRKNNAYLNPLASRLELDLWTLRNDDQYHLTRNMVLFSSQVVPK
ncbi:M23 family metallopeptidase [Polynucleobacter kasalickyi]|nr:M23 family metallopeptidase [Polynucleobacter kasalickyi]